MENISNYMNSLNEDMFICGQCKIALTSLSLFLDHKKTCNVEMFPEKSLSIAEDEPVNRSETHLSPTNTGDTRKDACNVVNNIYCKKCQKPFQNLKSLELHLKTHIGEKPYQCPICGRCFIQNSHLQRHLQSHKVWPDGLSDTTSKASSVDSLCYACSYCDAILSNYNQFRLHLKIHVTLKKFKCIQNECISLFDNVELLLQHITNNHKQSSYICHLCNITYNSLEEIAIHQQGHKENKFKSNKKYKCLHCDASFSKRETLSLHMSTNNHKKVCAHCKKIFVSDKRLRLHLQIHRPTKLFNCKICGLSFQMKKYLSAHMLKHGERQYTCNICKGKFKRKDILNRHLKSHQNTKKLQCPFRDKLNCKMEFHRSDKLKLHINFHTKRMAVVSDKKKLNNTATSTLEILIVPLNSKEGDTVIQNMI